MVPDRFQVPISAPTASKMNIAVTIEDSPRRPDSAISSQLCPFRRMTTAVTMQHTTSAVWSGPSSASRPNR